jgi:hypothetical protein
MSDPTAEQTLITEETVEDAANAADTQAYASNASSDNKWSKNGFGQGVTRPQTGKFSKEESEIVRKAVEDFCSMKQISVARLCSECDHKAELKGAWMEIAKRLPHRSVQSVYRHGLRQLHPFKRGAWTEEECENLLDLVQRTGKKWAAIQQKLNRSADSCRDKYREMSDDYVRGRWKENETEMLKRLIREHLTADPTADIKELGKMVEGEGIKIPWSVISKRMAKRSRLSCFKKWQKMTGLFSPSDQYKPPARGASEDAASAVVPKIEDTSAARAAKPTPPTHAAPTAGAAAALAANVVNNPIGDTVQASSSTDFDLYLLSELASFGVTRSSDVNWEGLRLDHAQERWHELLEEWQSDNVMDDSILALPLSEIAQLMLDRKTSAQRAAETVEAVDLPPPETLHTREV